MPGSMAVKSAAFPVSLAGLFRLEPRLATKRRQKSIRIQREQIFPIRLDRLSERAIEEAEFGVRVGSGHGDPVRSLRHQNERGGDETHGDTRNSADAWGRSSTGILPL